MALNSNFRTLTADNIEGIVEDRNYLKSSFENGTITGWTEVAVTLTSGLPTGTPTIGATAASSLALSATSVTPLSGSRSLLVDVPSALTAGHGFISDEFTLDRMDLGKVLTVSFDYERVTGTYNFSGTLGSQTWMVYIYDATAGGANWIQPAGFLGMNQSSGPGRIRATFQSSVVAGQKYRVAVIASQASAGASSIEFDNFTCSRQTAPIGPVVTDWVSYTPTGSWVSGATYTGKYRRVGDSIQCSVKIAITGPVTATDLQVSIPSGFSIDTAKMASGDFLQSVFGTAHAHDVSTLAHYNLQIGYASPTLLFFTVQNQLTGQVISVTNTAPQTWANGDAIHATFMVPVAGASSNVQLSNDTDTRVVAFNASVTTASVGINSTVTCALSSVLDTHNGISGGSSYVIPVSGIYELSASGWVGTGSATLSDRNIYIDVDGVTVVSSVEASGFGTNHSPFVLRRLNAGQVITWKIGNGAVAINSVNVIVNASRLSGPSVVAASEVVEATYGSTAGNVMNNGTEMWLDFPTKVRDTHNAVSGAGTGNKTVSNTGWKFTAPVTGRYYVNAVWHIQSAAVANSVAYGYIAVNGAGQSHSDIKAGQNPVGDAFGVQINGEVFLNAGDFVEIVGYQANGANRNQQASSLRNRVQIVKVGNY